MTQDCCDEEFFKLPGSVDEQLAAICKALAHPARTKLIRILINRGECVCGDLADEFELAQSTISEHLRILKSVGLIIGTIDGQKRCYCINEHALKALKNLIQKL